MNRDSATYGKVRRKFEEWREIAASKPLPARVLPSGPYVPEPETHSEMGKTIFTAIGVGIGLTLLALAAFAFYTAASWADLNRDGAATGYNLVGFFLLVAGIGGIAATWNHNFRVLTRPGGHH